MKLFTFSNKYVLGDIALIFCALRYFGGILLGLDTQLVTAGILFLLLLAVIKQFNLFFLSLLVFFLLISTVHFTAINFVFMLCVCYLYRGIEISRFARFAFRLHILIILLLLICLFLGVIENEITDGHKQITYSLGFNNANSMGSFMYATLCSFFVGYIKKGRFIVPVIFLFFSFFIYHLSGSRTAFGGEMLMLIIYLIYKVIGDNFYRYTKAIISILPIIMLLFTLYFTLNWTEYEYLNILLSDRLKYASFHLSSFSSTKELLIGKNIEFENLPLDNVYIVLLFFGGIFCLLLFIYTYFQCINKMWNKIIYCLPYLISLVVAGLCEALFIGMIPGYLILWVIIFQSFYGKYNKKNTSVNCNSCL